MGVRIDPIIEDILKEKPKEKGLTLSKYVEKILKDYCENLQSGDIVATLDYEKQNNRKKQ